MHLPYSLGMFAAASAPWTGVVQQHPHHQHQALVGGPAPYIPPSYPTETSVLHRHRHHSVDPTPTHPHRRRHRKYLDDDVMAPAYVPALSAHQQRALDARARKVAPGLYREMEEQERAASAASATASASSAQEEERLLREQERELELELEQELQELQGKRLTDIEEHLAPHRYPRGASATKTVAKEEDRPAVLPTEQRAGNRGRPRPTTSVTNDNDNSNDEEYFDAVNDNDWMDMNAQMLQ